MALPWSEFRGWIALRSEFSKSHIIQNYPFFATGSKVGHGFSEQLWSYFGSGPQDNRIIVLVFDELLCWSATFRSVTKWLTIFLWSWSYSVSGIWICRVPFCIRQLTIRIGPIAQWPLLTQQHLKVILYKIIPFCYGQQSWSRVTFSKPNPKFLDPTQPTNVFTRPNPTHHRHLVWHIRLYRKLYTATVTRHRQVHSSQLERNK